MPCTHEKVELDGEYLCCKNCGKKIDVKNMTPQEVADLLKKMQKITPTGQRAGSVACYSPIQTQDFHSFSGYNKKSTFPIGWLIVICVLGLIIYFVFF